MPETGKSQSAPNKEEEVPKEGQEDVGELKAQLADAQKKAQVLDKIDQKYKNDPNFREQFDKSWYGKKEESREEVNPDATPLDEIRSQMRAANEREAELRKELDGFKNVFVSEKVLDGRQKVNYRYEEDFKSLAGEVGYEPGTDAYDILFDNTVKAGYNIAKKYGLVADNGAPDPLLKYNENLMREAFKVSFEKHKNAGFDSAWKKKQEAQNREREKEAAKNDELAQFFKPENLKTLEGRSKALERAFKFRMKGHNFSLT